MLLLIHGYYDVCTLMNHTSVESLNWYTPMQMLTGSTSDISILLQFRFYQPVYFSHPESKIPSNSTELKGRFVGFADHVGDTMTFKVLCEDTTKVLFRSNVRSAEILNTVNYRLDTDKPDEIIYIKSRSDDTLTTPSLKLLLGFNPSDLIGRNFLDLPEDKWSSIPKFFY